MIKTIIEKTYINNEGFEFTFEPIEDTLKIVKTKAAFEVKYLTMDNDPINPREDENYSTMLCFHKRYTLGDKTDLKSSDFTVWEEVKEYLIKVEKAIVIFPLYLYDHSGISIKIGSFQGLLPQGHAEFDSGQVGFIYMTTKNLEEVGIKKSKAEQYLINEVETYNQYIQGDVYCIVKETYDHNKKQIDYDTCGGYYGYLEAKKALKTEI